MKSPPKIAVLASGDGSNFQAIVAAARDGILQADIVGLITNRAGIGALDRARKLGVPSAVLDPKAFAGREQWDQAVLSTLHQWGADWVALAGFLVLVGANVLKAFPERVVNIHPALLPKFGGPGMYGKRVHQAVLEAGVPETGITVHLVDLEYDRGRIVAQVATPTQGAATVDALAARVRELEHRHYPRVLNDLVWGRLTKS